ncbi:MAG TPA: cupin domain-containing protein, partial [Alphaproteobacteria bacterium]|nr:cupin domain-containing protein [Alphaproteobacteria bacterium]
MNDFVARMSKANPMVGTPKFLFDPYLDWLKRENLPVHEDFGADLARVETKPWARMGVPAGVVHLKGRGDFMSLFVIDLPPGGKTAPQKHIYEELIYVLSGRGSTTVETNSGTHSFEWGPNSLFALPLNTRYRHFNGSGSETARLVSANDLPIMLNLFNDESFVFENVHSFEKRLGASGYFRGEGERIETAPG